MKCYFVIFGMIIMLMLFAARKESGRHVDIDKVEHGRVHWHKEKTTMLRSTSNATTASLQENYNSTNKINDIEEEMSVAGAQWSNGDSIKQNVLITDYEACAKGPTPNWKQINGFWIDLHPKNIDIHVSGTIYRNSVWENDKFMFLDSLNANTFVDIGANIGVFTLQALHRGYNVVAVEGADLNIQRLCSSIIRNKFKNIKLYKAVVWDDDIGTLNFKSPKENAGGTHVDMNNKNTGVQKDTGVKKVLLDTVIYGLTDYVMKIDIEAAECRAFKSHFFQHPAKGLAMEWGNLKNNKMLCPQNMYNELVQNITSVYGKNLFDYRGWDAPNLQLPSPNLKLPLAKKKYIAQAGQDSYVDRQFKNKKINTGIFVEFGGLKGDEYSNTWFFEKFYNWHGIMIEAEQKHIAHLTKVRPNAVIYNNAVCPSGIEEIKFASSSIMGWGGIAEHIDDPRWTNNIKSVHVVKCVDLNQVLTNNNIVHVDYMTVDTEGSEFAILKTFQFNKFDVLFIQVEKNVKTTEQRKEKQELTEFMQTQDYVVDKVFDIGNHAVDILFRKKTP